jgi:hypothetical protein
MLIVLHKNLAVVIYFGIVSVNADVDVDVIGILDPPFPMRIEGRSSI